MNTFIYNDEYYLYAPARYWEAEVLFSTSLYASNKVNNNIILFILQNYETSSALYATNKDLMYPQSIL